MSTLRSLLALTLVFASAGAMAQRTYEVTITNLTRGQTFTPQLVVTHDDEAALFVLGEPASLGLEELAEGGATGTLTDELAAVAEDAVTIDGLLEPGQTVSTQVTGRPGRHTLSVAAMLIPTNDTFVALDSVPLPRNRATAVYMVPAYDAGTEANDQDCANIPGPRCGGAGFDPNPAEGDEGYVYISNGFHAMDGESVGELLGPVVYDWRNPVARITVRRVRQ